MAAIDVGYGHLTGGAPTRSPAHGRPSPLRVPRRPDALEPRQEPQGGRLLALQREVDRGFDPLAVRSREGEAQRDQPPEQGAPPQKEKGGRWLRTSAPATASRGRRWAPSASAP